MEFRAKRGDFLATLYWSQGIVERRNTMPILANVLIEARNGKVYLTATDLEVGIRGQLEGDVRRPVPVLALLGRHELDLARRRIGEAGGSQRAANSDGEVVPDQLRCPSVMGSSGVAGGCSGGAMGCSRAALG